MQYTEVVKIHGYATVGILSTSMESLPETGHGEIGDSVKKSYKNVLRYGPPRISGEDRLKKSGLTTLKSRR